ncbi:glycosyltransferase [Novosphingobium album (ex Liu et al. 2023)]|uniref:Glycosyltransferase n=1 Tax=Novosphingobium album (ex Liu et al. 2023) TaxID=3031130 RepID=A0ABT5WNP5_9SPHN|nr:glycosyltransferase [Novosphingobium album (ex Liu et al. 2023)]MDE8650892.1 glycosyltransferase [Novosphingobium album (ex Liu et al. 2023)]
MHGVTDSMQRPLRIVVPIHSFEPGGVERVALGLAREWSAANHHVTVVLGRPEGAERDQAPPLDYWRIPTCRSTAGFETPWMIHSLYSRLVRDQADIVFCPGNTYAVVGAAMRVLLGDQCPPLVLKISNDLIRADMPPLLRRGYRVWLRMQGSLFDRLVAMAPPMQREIRESTRAHANQIAIITNPVLPRRRLERLAAIRRKPASPWGMHYAAAGRLAPQKNLDLLLHAFARAARPADRLTIAGEGPERGRLEALARHLGIAAQVSLPGHLPSIEALLASADAFVLSSAYEGLPGAVVEALAAGLPVVATDCSASMADLLDGGRQGLLVPVGDEHALAAALADVRGFAFDPARSRAIAARFELETASARYLDMMLELRRQAARQREQTLAWSSCRPPASGLF